MLLLPLNEFNLASTRCGKNNKINIADEEALPHALRLASQERRKRYSVPLITDYNALMLSPKPELQKEDKYAWYGVDDIVSDEHVLGFKEYEDIVTYLAGAAIVMREEILAYGFYQRDEKNMYMRILKYKFKKIMKGGAPHFHGITKFNQLDTREKCRALVERSFEEYEELFNLRADRLPNVNAIKEVAQDALIFRRISIESIQPRSALY